PPSLAPATGTTPAATAAAVPPEDPPGVLVTSHGLRVGGTPSGSVTPLVPNSDVAVRPKITSPASSQRSTTSELSCAGIFLSDREPALEGMPAYSCSRSFTRNG